MMSSRLKRGTNGLLQAEFGGKVKVVKHDSYFGLNIRSWLRNSHLGLGIRVHCYGRYMQVFGFRARYMYMYRSRLHLSQPVSKPSAPVAFWGGLIYGCGHRWSLDWINFNDRSVAFFV